MIIYHVTTEKKAKRYHESGCIYAPVRGFDNLQAAMYWGMKVGRKVIYSIEAKNFYKMPDHHNKYGHAYWIDETIPISNLKCEISPKR